MNTKHWLCCVSVAMMLGFMGHAVAESTLSGGVDAARDGYYDQAAKIFKPLARQGSGQAQFNLALMYHSGLGVSRNEAEAVRLYHESAGNGYPTAQEYLSVGYAEGWFGLGKDSRKATFWQEKAADQMQ